MTAYRQRALACAAALREGPRRPCDLREVAPDAATILLRNVYGWFEREARGVYRLSVAGEATLLHWAKPDASYEAEASCPPSTQFNLHVTSNDGSRD
jgi:hypothetical protein